MFWGAVPGGWWYLHPGRPTEETWPTQRSSRSHSGPPLRTNQTKSTAATFSLDIKTEDVPIFSTYNSLVRRRQLFSCSPRLERVLDLSIMAFLFSTERFAKDRSAVTRVMVILKRKHLITSDPQLFPFHWLKWTLSQLKIPSRLVAPIPPMKCERQNTISSDTELLSAELHRLTCRQICASGSRTTLSASCQSPNRQRNRKRLRNVYISIQKKQFTWIFCGKYKLQIASNVDTDCVITFVFLEAN